MKQKLEVPLATAVETVVGRATEQLKTNVGRVFDQREERKRGKRKAKKREDLGLLFPFLSRAIFIFLVHSHPHGAKKFPGLACCSSLDRERPASQARRF